LAPALCMRNLTRFSFLGSCWFACSFLYSPVASGPVGAILIFSIAFFRIPFHWIPLHCEGIQPRVSSTPLLCFAVVLPYRPTRNTDLVGVSATPASFTGILQRTFERFFSVNTHTYRLSYLILVLVWIWVLANLHEWRFQTGNLFRKLVEIVSNRFLEENPIYAKTVRICILGNMPNNSAVDGLRPSHYTPTCEFDLQSTVESLIHQQPLRRENLNHAQKLQNMDTSNHGKKIMY